jgi:hypothetical protein
MRRVGMILGQSSSNEKQDDTTAAKEDVSSEEQKLLVESPDPSAEEATQVKSDIDKKGSKKKRKKRKTKSKDISEEPEPKDEEPKSKKRKKKDTKSENDDDDSDNDDKETPKQQSIENKANVGEKKDEESKDDDKQEEADDSSDDDSDDDDDDEELMAAAAAWAQEQTGEEAETPSNAAKSVNANVNVASPAIDAPANPTNLSLHITQLPYDTNNLDIRRLFSEQGCFVTSIRLVCDQDENGRKTVFRGVAFVDLANVESYQTALEMDRKHKVRGRKLNVRPVRSKEELADVVTRANVTEKIRKQLEDGPVQKEGGADKKEKKKKKEKDKNSPAKK